MNMVQKSSAQSSSSEPAVTNRVVSKSATTTPKKSAAPTKAAAKPQAAKPLAVKPPVKKQTPATAKPLKDKKIKVIRDSFTIPKTELMQIGEMKKRALALGIEIKKSELIRAGLSALTSMHDASFKKSITSVATIKTGRPAKD